MKQIALIVAITGLVLAGGISAEEKLSDADLKWGQAVQEMIRDGKREFSTPHLRRTELLKSIAQKLGYTCDVVKRDNNSWVIVMKSPAGSTSDQLSLGR